MHLPICCRYYFSDPPAACIGASRRYLALGLKAVNLALLVGIFPYILKLLQSLTAEIKQVPCASGPALASQHLPCGTCERKEPVLLRTVSNRMGKSHYTAMKSLLCWRNFAMITERGSRPLCSKGFTGPACRYYPNLKCCSVLLLKRWICLCIYKYCEDFGWSKYVCLAEEHIPNYTPFLKIQITVRASAVLALGEIFGASDPGTGRWYHIRFHRGK